MGVIRSFTLICVVSSLAAGGAAYGQVHVNTGALDSLSSSTEPSAPESSSREKAAAPHRGKRDHKASPDRHSPAVTKPRDKVSKTASKPEPPAPPAPPVTIAPSPPPVAVIAPPPAMPPPRPIAPPLIPMVAGAAGDVSPLPGGLRITFGPGKSDLSPATVETLHQLSQALIAKPDADVNVLGYAAGAPDDPSTPRRLSLSRALAVRAVLLGDKIASTRIYPRALGSTASDGPGDRVDVQQVGAAAPPPVATPAPADAVAQAPKTGSATMAAPSPTASPAATTPPPPATAASKANIAPATESKVTAPASARPRVSTGLSAPRTP